jgi:PTH2 family peptidyl-tRNA hydrolase
MTEFRYKQVIVFRSDLKLSKGKIAAQAGHGAVSAAEEARKHHKAWWKAWMEEGQCKIVVKVKGERDILGVGPAPSEIIDKLTGKLPLL